MLLGSKKISIPLSILINISSWVQHFLTQATYWHDPLNEVKYIDGSTFLADINNEKTINKTYVTNLLKLENLVLVRFDNDSIVQPVDTEWFGFYKPGQDKETQTLQESDIYQKVSYKPE